MAKRERDNDKIFENVSPLYAVLHDRKSMLILAAIFAVVVLIVAILAHNLGTKAISRWNGNLPNGGNIPPAVLECEPADDSIQPNLENIIEQAALRY